MTSKSAGIDQEALIGRAKGALIGAAIGDALGATVEFMSKAEIKAKYGIHREITGGGWLYLKPGQVTDDTQMSLCVGRAIIEKGTMCAETVAGNFARWLTSGPVDVGDTCANGIRRFIATGEIEVAASRWHAGNGAVMRMAPVALATLGSDIKLEKWAKAQAHITHNNDLSDAACLAVGEMVQAGVVHGTTAPMNTIVNALVARNEEFSFRPYAGKSSAYIPETIATVLHSFFTTDNFEDCLIATVNQGGDADTTGCIAGMIAGAFYGIGNIPGAWLKKLDGNVADELMEQASRLVGKRVKSVSY